MKAALGLRRYKMAKHDVVYDDINDDEFNDDDDNDDDEIYQITMEIWKKHYASDTSLTLLGPH